jgi:hypothetical protein
MCEPFSLVSNYPLSYFPQGGKGASIANSELTPSPLGEGWEGGNCELISLLFFYLLQEPCHISP